MEKLNLESYRKVNASFRRRMVYRVGVDCGFFVELNYMVNAMLYCLAHRIRFQMYSEDANFGTGTGWTEYFLPFCEEVHERFHQKYNFHRLPSWRNILRHSYRQKSLCAIAWKFKGSMKNTIGKLAALWTYREPTYLSQDVYTEEMQRLCIPELGIDIDYMSAYAMVARMVWQFNPDMVRLEESYKKKINLPSVYYGVQIRGGDKITETQLIDGKIFIGHLGIGNENACLFILTDDYRQFQEARKDFPELNILTLCQQGQEGYYHQRFCNEDAQSKKDGISRLLISVDILLSSQAFAGSITTGPSVFIMKARHRDLSVQAVDCPREELATALRLPISKRSTISTEHLSRHATR